MRAGLCGLFFLLFGSMGFSQREAANWYFGENAGLNFNTGAPEVLLDGRINTIEGCETFSDSDGNLLFYTDGKTVWNSKHRIMPNGEGLKGSLSTSQAALVVPYPGQNLYYIFTPDDALTQRNGITGGNGFNFSVVDMSLNNGLGDIVLKNQRLLSQCSEKVSAIRNSNGGYYWVVTHFKDTFYAYKVDGNGVALNPVTSTVGPNIDNLENIRGTIKISPDGAKLAITHTIVEPKFQGSFYLFDFDVETGRVNNPQQVSGSRIYYGVEFSSNSKKLYGSGVQYTESGNTQVLGPIEIVQFDLEDPSIQGTEYVVGSFTSDQEVFVAGALQLAMDKKIYHSFPDERLSVIRSPNLKGIHVDFRPSSISLGDRLATFGLPPFVQSFFETIVTVQNFCEGNSTNFRVEPVGDIASISWNFGDPTSGGDNFSTDLSPSHTFSSTGTFTVTMDVVYTNGNSRQFVEFVEISEIPNVPAEVDLVQCDIDGLDDGITIFNLTEAIPLFNNVNQDVTALFFENEADALANINQLYPYEFANTFSGQEVYARVFENAECAAIVRVNLMTQPLSDLGLYDTVLICDANPTPSGITVDATEVYDWLFPYFEGYEQVSLYKNKEQALFEREELKAEPFLLDALSVTPYELYFRVESENSCAFIGKVLLRILPKPEFEETVQINLCNGAAVLQGPEGYETYLWSNGEQNRILEIYRTGTVDVVFGSDPCLYVQTFEVLPERKVAIDEIAVQDFTKNNSLSVVLNAEEDVQDVRFSIDGGRSFEVNNTFTNLLPGIYKVLVDNGCSVFEKEVLVGGIPSFFTPNNDGANDRLVLNNPEYFPSYQMSVFNRYGKLLSTFTAAENGWDGTYGAMEMPPDDYWYILELADGRLVKGYFTLKR